MKPNDKPISTAAPSRIPASGVPGPAYRRAALRRPRDRQRRLAPDTRGDVPGPRAPDGAASSPHVAGPAPDWATMPVTVLLDPDFDLEDGWTLAFARRLAAAVGGDGTGRPEE